MSKIDRKSASPDDVSPMKGAARRVPWALVILFTTLGVVVLVAAGLLTTPRFGAEFWSGVLVNGGATILLAAVLIWFERRLTTTTKRAVENAVSDAADQAGKAAAAAVQEATEDLKTRIDSLQDQVAARRARAAADQDAAIDALSEELTWDNVASAMETAAGLNATEGAVFVWASNIRRGPVLGFQYDAAEDNVDDRDLDGERDRERGVILSFEEGGGPAVMRRWTKSQSAPEFFADFSEDLVASGYGNIARSINYSLVMKRLQDALADGVAGRRVEPGAWRTNAPLWEVIDGDWAITFAGLEHRDHRLVLSTHDIPHRGESGRWEPAQPEWADEHDWEQAVRRVQRWRAAWSWGKGAERA